MAAGRARRGADRRLRNFGGSAAEDGHLRPAALLPATLPRCGEADGAVGGGTGDNRHRVRRAGFHGAAGPEKAHRLFLGESPRVCRAGNFFVSPHRHSGRYLPDAEPRHLHRRALLDCGNALRPPTHAPDQRIRRAGYAHAGTLGVFPVCVPVIDRVADAQRLRGRILDFARDLSGEQAVGHVGSVGSDSRRRVFAVGLPARRVR